MPELSNPSMNFGDTGYNWFKSKLYYPILAHKHIQDRMFDWLADPRNIPGYYGVPQGTYYVWFERLADVAYFEDHWGKGGKFFLPDGHGVRLLNNRHDENTIECLNWLTLNGHEYYFDIGGGPNEYDYQYVYIYDPDAAMYAKLRWQV
jgi:hypothetical protein